MSSKAQKAKVAAEDLQDNKWLTRDVGAGGAGFGSRWNANFVHPIRQAVITPQDGQRSLVAIRDAIRYRYNDDAFERVIYSESRGEVASGQARVPQEINSQHLKGWYAQKRSTLAAAMVFTAPGIPMLFQGQEFLEGGWFRDTVPVDRDQREEFHGIVRLYHDLIRLRINRDGFTRGLCGQFTRVYHLQHERKVIAFHRWDKGGPADDVVVVANFLHQLQDGYVIGFPATGPGSSVSTATGKVTAKTSKVIRVPMWFPNQASTTASPATPRFRLAPTVC